MQADASSSMATGGSSGINENGELGSLTSNGMAGAEGMANTSGGLDLSADAGVDAAVAVEQGPRLGCERFPNAGSVADGDANIDLDVEFQRIAGFGGINVPEWTGGDLTVGQSNAAFGNGPGQIGMSILRVRIPPSANDFQLQLPTAQRAVAMGATVFATPWTPPINMKTNNSDVAGELNVASYRAYADHLLRFRDFMESNGVPIEAISVQNEPDIEVDYESCDWTPQEMINWLIQEGPRFGDTKLMVAESFNFNRDATDPLLNDPAAAAEFEIVGGHIYGNGLFDYPLARNSGKEIWMTEHYIASDRSANEWPLALGSGTEIHENMVANFSAYVWWYIRRAYGPITENGQVSKRGYLMAQYSKYIRPNASRVAASQPTNDNIRITAYKDAEAQIAVVAVNTAQTFDIDVHNGCVESFDRVTTSETKNLTDDGNIIVTDSRITVTVDAESVTTFIGR